MPTAPVATIKAAANPMTAQKLIANAGSRRRIVNSLASTQRLESAVVAAAPESLAWSNHGQITPARRSMSQRVVTGKAELRQVRPSTRFPLA